MSADNGNGDSGSKDRATVALVDAKVDGLKDLIRAEIGNLRDDIKPLLSLVVQVALLEAAKMDHERRLAKMEGEGDKERDYKKYQRPAFILTSIVALLAIIFNILNLIHI